MSNSSHVERIALGDSTSSSSPLWGEVDRVKRGRVRGFPTADRTPSPRPSPRRGEGVWWSTALACCVLAASALGSPAHADKVGVAAAVNPDAFSSLSGSPQTQLNIGKSIFFNERINTTGEGLVQVLLADGSTFTVGPGSDLVIDKFVYDPKKKSGEVVASFSKGVMRFVGGKISKNEGGVKVNTPSGALAIRGGMFQGKVGGGGSVFSFLYGVEMKLTAANGKTFSVYEPGYTLDLTGGTPTVRPTTAQDTNAFMAALTNSNTNAGTQNANDKVNQQTQLVTDTISLQDLISDANATKVDDTLTAEEQDAPPPNSGTPPPDTGTPPDNTPPPPDVTRTLTGYASGYYYQTQQPEGPGNQSQVSDNNIPGPVEFGRVSSQDPGDFSLVFNETKQTIESSMKLASSNEGGATLGFGGGSLSSTPGNGAWGLGANPDTTIIQTDEGPVAPNALVGAMVSPGTPLCTNCDFIKWGGWGVGITFRNSESVANTQVVAQGWWVAGDIPTVGQLPTQGIASYEGTTIGSIAKKVEGQWAAFPAAGRVAMLWDFGSRKGGLAITNFKAPEFQRDVVSVVGVMSVPGEMESTAANKFTGKLIGNAGLSIVTGSAAGSFVRNGTDAGAGVIGNWNAGNNRIRAEGIFGAKQTGMHLPPPPNGLASGPNN